jgi:hypothetical protein
MSFPVEAEVEGYLEKGDVLLQQNKDFVASYLTDSLSELDSWSAAKTFTQAKQLALAILPISEIATQVAYDAMLSAQVCRNKQYTYRKSWLKNNRYKKYGPTKALLHKNQLVQNFVYREIEKYEKYTEGDLNQPIDDPVLEELLKNFSLSEEILVIRYLKFLMQIAEDNSANAVLAITKLIYKYRTIDAAEIYTRLHGDGPVDNYFSKRKGEFIRRLEERFQSLIKQEILSVVVGNKREKYFYGQETFDNKWAGLVKETFTNFVPWGTTCPPENPKDSFINNFFGWLKNIFSQDQKKILSIHALFCPNCFTNLVKELKLPNPEQQLALPIFNISKEKSSTMSNYDQNTFSEKTETRNVLNKLQNEHLRRERLLSVGVKDVFITNNGVKVLDLDLSKDRNAKIIIRDNLLNNKNILKVYSVDRQGDLLLASVVLDKFDRSWTSFFAQEEILLLDGDQKLTLFVTCSKEDEEKSQYILTFKYIESFLEETGLFWQEYSSIMQSVWLK